MENKYSYKDGIVYLNQYHIIFCPKFKRIVLVDNVEKDLREIFYDIAKEKEVEIKLLEIMPDRVHMVISIDPRQPLHELIRYFKGISSRILREKYPKLKSRLPSFWTHSYFCCTIGHLNEEVVRKFIEDQKNNN